VISIATAVLPGPVGQQYATLPVPWDYQVVSPAFGIPVGQKMIIITAPMLYHAILLLLKTLS